MIIVQPGSPPPGSRDEDGKWVGEDAWAHQFGPSLLHMLFGKANRVENAVMPDGSTGDLIVSLDHDGSNPVVWRRYVESAPCELGYILASDIGIAFVHDLELDLPERDHGPLGQDLLASEEVHSWVQDRCNAESLYATLVLHDWKKSGVKQGCVSSRLDAGLVAKLRRRKESYLDFYGQGEPSAAAYDLLERLGWKQTDSWPASSRDITLTAKKAVWSFLDASKTPDWLLATEIPSDAEASPELDMLFQLAKLGRVSEAEFRAKIALIRGAAGQ